MKGNILGANKRSMNKDKWQNFGQDLDIERVVGNKDAN